METVTFGRYWQQDDNQKTPIEWDVVTKDNEKCLLVSHYALDAKTFDDEMDTTRWALSSLKRWLNSSFFSHAFTEEEQAFILQIPHEIDFIETGTEKVFLLSLEEAEKYYPRPKKRICIASQHTRNALHSTNNDAWVNSDGSCFWWLRDLGDGDLNVSYVGIDGEIHGSGIFAAATGFCVRPAVWIPLDTALCPLGINNIVR